MDCSLAEDVTYILWKREARVSSNKRQKEKPARWSCNVHLACSFPLQRTQLKEMKESVWMANLKRLLHFEGRESFQEIFCISSTLNSSCLYGGLLHRKSTTAASLWDSLGLWQTRFMSNGAGYNVMFHTAHCSTAQRRDLKKVSLLAYLIL